MSFEILSENGQLAHLESTLFVQTSTGSQNKRSAEIGLETDLTGSQDELADRFRPLN